MDKLIGSLVVFMAQALLAIVGGTVVSFLYALFAGTFIHFLWAWAAPIYFAFLPAKYIVLPWLHVVLLTWLFAQVGAVLFKSK